MNDDWHDVMVNRWASCLSPTYRLKALGKEHLSENVFAKIREEIDAKSYAKILRDTQGSTGWIYEAIKQTFKENMLAQRKQALDELAVVSQELGMGY